MHDRAHDPVAVDLSEEHARQREQRDERHRGVEHRRVGALFYDAAGLVVQPARAVEHDHRKTHQPAQQREGIEQRQQRDLAVHAHHGIEAERHALEQVSERHAEDQRRHHAARKQRPVPEAAPVSVLQLAAEFESRRPQDQRRQHQEHGQIEAGETRGIEHRPGGEDGAAAQDEPHLIAFPHRPHGVEHHAALLVGASDERQQRRDSQIESVHHRETDQQYAHERPPDEAQDFVFAHVASSGASLAASGPRRMNFCRR